MVSYLKIPKERLRVLFEDKKTIPDIERATQTKIAFDKETEQIEVYETEDMPDPLGAWRASDVIKAIGRGFSKKTAFRLLEEDSILKVIDLKEIAGKRKNALQRMKSRIIGTEGRAKQTIRKLTNTDIAVYGKTVSIIGQLENTEVAGRAVSMLCGGAMHSTVFKMLKREAKW